MGDNDTAVRQSRRGILSAFAGTGVAAILPSVAADGASARTATDSSADAVALGTFESRLDGWVAGDGVRLSRVARTDRPVAVTQGEHALRASVEGAASPAVARPVGDVDLAARPYLVADAAPGRVRGTDAPVAFRFRLYREADAVDDPWGFEPAAASGPVTVRQAAPGRVFWDASDVDDALLDAAAVLAIGWHPADRDPDAPGGTVVGDGGAVLDAVRASPSVDTVGRARLAATLRDLQFAHGPAERTEVTAETGAGEQGTLAFADGATEPYAFEALGDDRFRLTVAGTEVRLGRGWSR